MRGEHWCQCDDVTIIHNEVKSHEWQQACCQWTGIHGGQEALADGNSKGSEDYGNEGDEESKGVEGNKGEGDKGDDGNFPKREMMDTTINWVLRWWQWQGQYRQQQQEQ